MGKLPKPKILTEELETVDYDWMIENLSVLRKKLDTLEAQYSEYANLRFDFPTGICEHGMSLYGDRLETEKEIIKRKNKAAREKIKKAAQRAKTVANITKKAKKFGLTVVEEKKNGKTS